MLDADDGIVKRRDAARKKDSRKDRKDKGYVMFEEEDSEEELVADDAVKYVDSSFAYFSVLLLCRIWGYAYWENLILVIYELNLILVIYESDFCLDIVS